jgi:hypothetical protein
VQREEREDDEWELDGTDEEELSGTVGDEEVLGAREAVPRLIQTIVSV